MAFLGFYFEKKMHAELPWQQMQHTFLFERLSQVNWHDVGMMHAFIYRYIGLSFTEERQQQRCL